MAIWAAIDNYVWFTAGGFCKVPCKKILVITQFFFANGAYTFWAAIFNGVATFATINITQVIAF